MNKEHRPHGKVPTAWEADILKIRAFEMVLVLFYMEDLRRFIMGSIEATDELHGVNRLSDGKPKTKEGKRLSTFDARREGMAKSWTYGGPWRKGQRCIIPAQRYVEPYWGAHEHIAWQFARANGEPWGLAGLWSEWTDPVSGEVVPNFTMMTQNCDQAPVFNLMHRRDPKRPDNMQDKRMVVPLEKCEWDTWLHGTLNEAEALIRVPPLDLFVHGPLVEGLAVTLPSQ